MSNKFNVLTLAALLTAMAVSGCGIMSGEKRQREDMIKNTIECESSDGKMLVRFMPDEVRVLMPDRTRIYLYKMPSARGVLFTNGDIELLGRGVNISFGPVGDLKPQTCVPYDPEKRDDIKEDERDLKEMMVY